jgi:hypothetical protein
MTELFRTRDQLIDEALVNLFADGGAGQAPDAESQATVDRKVDGLFAELRAREICTVVNDQQIPPEWFNPLAELLANECATAFGAQKSVALREDAMARLKDMARNEPMRLLGTDPMLRARARGRR